MAGEFKFEFESEIWVNFEGFEVKFELNLKVFKPFFKKRFNKVCFFNTGYALSFSNIWVKFEGFVKCFF